MDTPQDLTHLGITLGRYEGQLFGIRQADRAFHLFILGQTGTGKSSLLAAIARQDVEQGRGFCLIDPHGDLAGKVAVKLAERGTYWNAGDSASPFGYNPLAHVALEFRPLAASSLIESFKKQWGSQAWGARMEHLLRFALLALLDREEATLADIVPLFLDKEFREEVIDTIVDDQVRQFWTVEYTKLRYQMSNDGVSSIANKLGAFLAHPVVRKAVCEPQVPISFRRLMDEGGMLAVNLAKGRLGADVSNLLGGLIVSGIASAAYTRQDQPEADRRSFTLIVDEFHSFTTSAFAGVLSELRKYGCAVTLVSQHFAQIENDIREAILGNVGTLIAFRLGATDAALVSRQFGEDLPRPRDLVNLANHEAFVKLMVDGVQTKPFSMRTLPP
jgi:type IV secretory pathway TraG/TraD family ATPase VirD4